MSRELSPRCSMVLLALALASPAAASVVESLSLARARALATDVVIGTVLEVRPVALTSGVIATDNVIRIDESLAGEARVGERLTVRELGGQLGNLVMEAEGSPRFEPGETVLLFLERRPDGLTARTVGLFQGAYTIEHAGGGAVAVQKPSQGAESVHGDEDAPLPARMALDDFRDAIARVEQAGQ